MPTIFFYILVCLTVMSCATTHVVKIDSASYTPTESVDVLDKEPSKAFKKIALLESEGSVNVQETDCIQNMIKKAKAMGADAIILKSQETAYGGGGIWGERYSKVRGIAIKYVSANE